jgi:hypothetical protein
MYKKANNNNKYASIGVCVIFIAAIAIIVSFSRSTTVNHISIIPKVSAQKANSAIMSKATTLRGSLSRLNILEYPAWRLAGQWNMSLAKPLASQPNPIAKSFDSSLVHSTLSGAAKHKDTISNFKQTNSSMNGKTSATINGTATITMGVVVKQNVPISIKLTKNQLELWIDPTKTNGHFGNLNKTPIYGTIDKGQ